MEREGGVERARARKDGKREKGAVDEKATMLVWELKQYGVYAAGMSETKWFGSKIFEIEDYTILHSGRNVHGDGEQMRRGEGVGLVLSPEATRA